MAKNTGIRIETVKEVSNAGKIGYRVISVAALPQDQLPAMYLLSDEKPVVYLENDGDIGLKNCPRCNWIAPETFYTTQEMKDRLAYLREAGQHLADCNATLKKERAAWSGPVVFVDGVAEPKPLKPSKPSVKLEESVPERIARLWAEGRLYYRDDTGYMWTFKPLAPAE